MAANTVIKRGNNRYINSLRSGNNEKARHSNKDQQASKRQAGDRRPLADGNAADDARCFGGTGGAPNVDSQHYATGSNALICWIMGITHYSTYDGWLRASYAVPTGRHPLSPKPMPMRGE